MKHSIRWLGVGLVVSIVGTMGGCALGAKVVGPPTASSFVTDKNLGGPRDDYGGWVGMKITVGPSPITVTALGRIAAPGNKGTHVVKIVRAGDGKDVASVTVPMAGGTAGAFVYGVLAQLASLAANTSYYVVAQEESGGDQWYHSDTTVTTTKAATCNSAVYWSNINQQWTPEEGEDHTFGPVDFQYR